jgi:hypothetical protein
LALSNASVIPSSNDVPRSVAAEGRKTSVLFVYTYGNSRC